MLYYARIFWLLPLLFNNHESNCRKVKSQNEIILGEGGLLALSFIFLSFNLNQIHNQHPTSACLASRSWRRTSRCCCRAPREHPRRSRRQLREGWAFLQQRRTSWATRRRRTTENDIIWNIDISCIYPVDRKVRKVVPSSLDMVVGNPEETQDSIEDNSAQNGLSNISFIHSFHS